MTGHTDTALTARLADALRTENVTVEGLEPWEAERLAAVLLPVVREYADRRAAEVLEAAAAELPYAPATKSQWLRDRAAALRGETGREP